MPESASRPGAQAEAPPNAVASRALVTKKQIRGRRGRLRDMPTMPMDVLLEVRRTYAVAIHTQLQRATYESGITHGTMKDWFRLCQSSPLGSDTLLALCAWRCSRPSRLGADFDPDILAPAACRSTEPGADPFPG